MGDKTSISWTDKKWCTACKDRHDVSMFGKDKSRGDGLAACCLISRRSGRPRGWHEKPIVNPLTGMPGPAPHPPRDGDKLQARQRINVEVRSGRRPHPNTLPCSDCGKDWADGESRHEYDHYNGYASVHHFDVDAVCAKCHASRSRTRGEIVHTRDSSGRYI